MVSVGLGGWIMFLRIVRATVSKGVKREYVRVVEAYRDHAGKNRHRTIINLGRKDLLAAHLDFGKLRRLLHGDAGSDDCVKREDVGAVGAWDWGPMLAARQLQQWYRTLDRLLACKGQLEHALFVRLRDLFSLRVDMVFYDLTSTYFEGEGPPALGAHGHSRDGKPRNRQVLVGLVMVDGWPIAHHVFAGNRRDAKTVPEVLRDLEQRFGLERIVFVGDRGMVTSQNLDDLRDRRR